MSNLPEKILLLFFADGTVEADLIAFEALEAAWQLYVEQQRDRVVTVRLISGATYTFKVSSLTGMTVHTAESRRLALEQMKELSEEGEDVFGREEDEPWK